MGKFITFALGPGGTFFVMATRSGAILGRIEWYPPWKQHVFSASPNTVWSHDCLDDVRHELLRLNKIGKKPEDRESK